jgi:hypothetical protein
MKLTIVVAAVFGYLLLTFACHHSSSSTTAAMLDSSAASLSSSSSAAVAPDGTNPPHAVDTDGKPIPEESATQPAKPIILAKDAEGKDGELKKEAAFDHAKHSTDAKYSVDGKTVIGCTECHHTDQPKAPAGQDYLKKLERKEVLTAAELEKSKQAVKSCRACHFQASAEATDDYPPDSITYAKESGKAATKDKIVNEEAYHLNCNTCHDQAMKNKSRPTPAKAPAACADCHTQKKA